MKRILIISAIVLAVFSLTNCGGGSGGSTSQPPAIDTTAAITSISPTTMPAYSSFVLTVTGRNFQPNSTVVWDNHDLITQFKGTTSMTATVTSSETQTVRTVSVEVRGPDSKMSNSSSFTVSPLASNPVPVINSTKPTTIQAGGADFTLTASGYYFVASSKIVVNGTERATTYVDTGTLTTQIAASEFAQPGTMHVSVTTPAPGGGASNSKDLPITPALTKIPLAAKSLIYDPTRQKIYASVGSTAPTNPNTVTVIDPLTGSIGASVSVGNDPNRMAISDDGKYLYVALESEQAIRRIVLATMTADLRFQPTTTLGKAVATDLAVMPGHSGTVAVAAWGEVAVYDDGVRRPNASSWTNSIASVQFGSTPDVLYGLTSSSANQLSYLTVDANGVTVGQQFANRLYGSRMYFDSGSLFGDTGANFDPASKNRLGRFPLVSSYCFVPDAKNGKAYSMAFASGGSAFTAYDATQFIPLSTVMIPTSPTGWCSLITWGSNGFAFANLSEVIITSIVFPQPEPLSAFGLDRVSANHLLYDRAKNKIYASVKGSVPTIGNSIITIDPATGTLESSVYVGSEPNVMALSADGKTLYVGLDQADSIRKVDLASATATELLVLRKNDSEGMITVNDLSAMPGSANTLAVARIVTGPNSTTKDVSIYDGSVSRAKFIAGLYYYSPMLVKFSDSAETLFGSEVNGGFVYSRMAVDSTGVTLNSRTVFDSVRSATHTIAYNGGRIFSNNGAVVDTASGNLVGVAGGLQDVKGFFLDAPSNRMYFLESAGKRNLAISYNMTTLAPIDYLEPAIAWSSTFDHDLVVLGNSSFAFAASDKVVLGAATSKPIPTMTIGSTVLPATASGKQYNFTLNASANAGTPEWSLDSQGGSLPPGLMLERGGRIFGTVGTVASDTTYTFRANVASYSVPSAVASRDFSILVKAGSLGSNDTCGTATQLSYGTIGGSISPYGDIDVYSFDGTQGGIVSIGAYPSQRFYGQNVRGLDPVVELLDNNCARLAMNDNSSSSTLNAVISHYTLPYSGKYYVRVLDARGDGRPDFSYDLAINPY